MEQMAKSESICQTLQKDTGATYLIRGTKSDQCRIRRMEKCDWPDVLLAIQSETNPLREWYNFSHADADVEFRVAPDWANGFFVIEDVSSGQLLGYVAGVKHGSRHGYIGGYYVQSSMLGTDLAYRLLQSAIDYLNGRNILMDFTCGDLSIPKYESKLLSQFKECAWHPIRYHGMPDWEHLRSTTYQQLYVCHAQMIRVEDIAEFDRTVSGQDRTQWLRYFLKHSNEGWIPRSVQLIVTDRRGDIRGYGCVRPGSCIARMGPIYARDFKTFLLLFRSLMGSSRDARTRGIDLVVTSANRQVIDYVQTVLKLDRLKLDEEDRLVKRFCSKWHPHVALDQAYCLTNCFTQYI